MGPKAPAKSSPTLTPFGAEDRRITDLGRAASTGSKKNPNPSEQTSSVGILARRSARSQPLRTGATYFSRVLSPVNAPEERAGGPTTEGRGMRTQFEIWTSRARGLLADALEYSQHVVALVEQTHLEALLVPDEPLLSWSVYLADTPAKWLGTVEAATPEEAFAEAAEKFKQPKDRLMAVRRA